MASFDVVIPTLGRPSLRDTASALAVAGGLSEGQAPGRVLVVHDGGRQLPRLAVIDGLEVLRGPGYGPAAARNVGWRASSAEWVAFLDDDVVPSPDWLTRLAEDLYGLEAGVAGSQGRIDVPLPGDRRPTDWERNVAGLATARWATADMAYRRSVLAEVGGFDERFRRAYREDADLALRVRRAGYRLARGRRSVTHPVRPADRWTSIRLQAGNADDALMAALHGDWRGPGEPRGRRRRHLAVTAAGALALGAAAVRHRRLAAAAAAGWLAGTAELAWARIAPGPRTRDEVLTMTATSAVIPAAASYHWLRGRVRWRGARPLAPRPAAVLLDRDGTLVVDVPYNGDPDRVEPMPGAREALDRLRAAGIPTAVVSNQSAIGRGWLRREQVEAVNRRVEELLGPLGPWAVCPHAPEDACECRKPRAGLVVRAAEQLGVEPDRCAVVGDIGADVEAARAVGARAVLVPTERTRPEEVAEAPETAPDLETAVDLLLGGAR
jgi:histidinol-phosphate phosphatase family protein